MAIEEVLNTQRSVRVELSLLGTRLCDVLRIYKPGAVRGVYALHLEGQGKSFACYMRSDGSVLQFGRLLIPVQSWTTDTRGRLILTLPVFQAGRMISYCRSRRWAYRAGDQALAAAYRGNVPDLAGALALVAS